MSRWPDISRTTNKGLPENIKGTIIQYETLHEEKDIHGTYLYLQTFYLYNESVNLYYLSTESIFL